jgi:hypothetical protein
LLLALAALAPWRAIAQLAGSSDAGLLQPVPDVDPPPPALRNSVATVDAVRWIEPAPSFGDRIGTGAGATGFDSSYGLRKKRLDGAPAKPNPAVPTISEARLPQRQNQTRPGIGVAVDQTTGAAAAPGAAPLPLAPALFLPPPLSPAAVPAVGPATARPLIRKSAVDDRPFDPVGIAAGAFLLRPAIELSGGYDSNPGRTSAGGGASAFGIVAPELQVESNWVRHALTANLRGGYLSYTTAPQFDRPDFNGRVDGRIDVSSSTAVNLESRLVVATDNPGSPNIQVGLAKLPIYADIGGSIGVAQRFNRFNVVILGSFDRTTYQESMFTDGTTASNDDRNFDQPSLQLRASYELTPGIRPFVEIDADRRIRDLAFDSSGYQRNSAGGAGKAGTSFELSRILTGEIALGSLTRTYRDPRLPAISGPALDGSLIWLATALTTVKLAAITTVNESTLAGVSGEFVHVLGVEIDHDFRRWLVGALKFTGERDTYVGSPRIDNVYVAAADLTHKLSRELWLKGELRREWRSSNVPGNDYLAYVALAGLRLQR